MNNSRFLEILKASFLKYLETGARSNEKLKILHGAISSDLSEKLKTTNDIGGVYAVYSLGFGSGQEKKIVGRYVDKAVDITISKDGQPVAGIAVKYVMSNYMQNSNNYFESMLGETANIRCNEIPYFQIFVIPDKIPYFYNSGVIKGWERISEHNLKKYITLSNDNIDNYLHTPNKTLVFIVNISCEGNPPYDDKKGYIKYYTETPFKLTLSPKVFKFENSVIYNDYEEFIKKVVHAVLSL
ncbi:MAG: hypothetical protein LBD85_01245 [Oscillospiraceae bacterium]|jgi:hypothetical protein|nr:hypothetical protein [Oscillospiraceae bacterium]